MGEGTVVRALSKPEVADLSPLPIAELDHLLSRCGIELGVVHRDGTYRVTVYRYGDFAGTATSRDSIGIALSLALSGPLSGGGL